MSNSAISWEPQPEGAAWVTAALESLVERHGELCPFRTLLLEETGMRLIDWVDHLIVRDVAGIEAAGFSQAEDGWWIHSGALLPPIRQGMTDRIMLRVDSVVDFAAANGSRFVVSVDGSPGDPLRTGLVRDPRSSVEFGVIEHHGCNIRLPSAPLTPEQKLLRQQVREEFRLRHRRFETVEQARQYTHVLVESAIRRVGRDAACDLFFEGERAYWQSRNRAGRLQAMRQQALGLGWGNHDHHTYRSSRENFMSLIALFERLGLQCRERFYAGREAGWGAQVMEHPVCGVIVFADVDLSPDEVTADFSHEPLTSGSEAGTIGLWCALHGEALFEAGMHHLECQFDYEAARRQLDANGVSSMKPFTSFSFLRQCFTEGETWSVRPERIQRALSAGWITEQQAVRFAADGAVGSHLEILERNDGYRGFNQTGINEIIRRTDPRFLQAGSAGSSH